MARALHIIDALKRELKRQGWTYHDLALALDLSESTIKVMFARKNFTLKRLDAICDLLNTSVSDLLSQHELLADKRDQLSISEEQALISDPMLLLITYCVTNHWTIEQIRLRYALSETDCIQRLAQLDRMKVIELLPLNRIRLLVSSDFRWQKNGPIERYFRTQVETHFFNASFAEDDALHMVKLGELSDKSRLLLIDRLNSIADYYEELSDDDRKHAFSKRAGTSLVIGIRRWEFPEFKKMSKENA